MISGPIKITRNGKTRIVRLSERHQELWDPTIMAIIVPERHTELSLRALRFCDSHRSFQGDVGWRAVSIALKAGRQK